jgi:hypothetical protein
MRRKQKQFLDNLTILGASVLLSITAITISSGLSFKTTDNTALLYQFLTGEKTQVKGAFSENNSCPKNKQIIGWIDFTGNKKIVQSLPEGIEVSSCFSSIEEAKKEGYVDQE